MAGSRFQWARTPAERAKEQKLTQTTESTFSIPKRRLKELGSGPRSTKRLIDLVTNGDLQEKTNRVYISGYFCKKLASMRERARKVKRRAKT